MHRKPHRPAQPPLLTEVFLGQFRNIINVGAAYSLREKAPDEARPSPDPSRPSPLNRPPAKRLDQAKERVIQKYATQLAPADDPSWSTYEASELLRRFFAEMTGGR